MNRPLFFTALLLLSLLLWQQDVLAADAPAPYGANLFQGNFSKEGKSGQVMPGDRIVLRLWGGSLTVDTTLTVDANGHVAIPEVGDMLAAGLAYDKLTDALRSKLAASGHADSQIYVAPLDNQPVSVFITGNVVRPGRYSGAANDTVLSFLDKAGGIELGAQRFDVLLHLGRLLYAQHDKLHFIFVDADKNCFQFFNPAIHRRFRTNFSHLRPSFLL